MAKTKHIINTGCEKAFRKKLKNPLRKINTIVMYKKKSDSKAENKAVIPFTSQRKGRKNVAAIPLRNISTGLVVPIL